MLSMNLTARFLTLTAVATSLASGHLAAQGGFIPPAPKELASTITPNARELFDAIFETCDIKSLATFIAEDFEFYHDKSGLAATAGSQWVKGVGEMCERQKQGTDTAPVASWIPPVQGCTRSTTMARFTL